MMMKSATQVAVVGTRIEDEITVIGGEVGVENVDGVVVGIANGVEVGKDIGEVGVVRGIHDDPDRVREIGHQRKALVDRDPDQENAEKGPQKGTI